MIVNNLVVVASVENRQRLDLAMVSRGLVETRARARDLVLRGVVTVGGRVAEKPALMVGHRDEVAITGGPADYVSRGALKLRHGLAHFGFSPAGRVAVDLGASTGGFTETLLAAGAAQVYAVDNGRGQLHPRIAADPRVISLESQDARELTAAQIAQPVTALVADVSFISLTKVLPAALALAAPGCWLVALIKPQFEAPRADIPRHGVIRDGSVQAAAVEAVVSWMGGHQDWATLGAIASPITGGDGNVEFLMGAVRNG